MIRSPTSPGEAQWCRDYLSERGNIGLSEFAHFLVMVTPGGAKPTWVVGYDDWVGQTCHLYVASDGKTPIPRELALRTFTYGFLTLKRKMLYSVCNSRNTRVLRLVEWLGFSELYRGYGLHEDSGDIVYLGFGVEAWKRKVHGQEKRTAAA